MLRNSSLFDIVVTLVMTVGDANRGIITEQEAKTPRNAYDQLESLRTKGLVML